MSFDYYQILQLNSTATNAEIKAAYRRLAKLYHPDKNPSAEEKFKQIKEAYETLINTIKRNKYDSKRNYVKVTQARKNETEKKQKNYNHSTEAELKRRQYYQEHYKMKTRPAGYTTKTEKPNYKELTSILISIPVAVALLLLLVNIYQKPKKEKTHTELFSKEIISEIKTSESPYIALLGNNVFDTLSKSYIKIINKSGSDAVVFLKNKQNKVVRHHFIENNYQLYMEGIPANLYYLYYYTGKGFSNKNYLFGNSLGNFTWVNDVDSFSKKIDITSTLLDSIIVTIPPINKVAKPDTFLLKRIFTMN